MMKLGTLTPAPHVAMIQWIIWRIDSIVLFSHKLERGSSLTEINGEVFLSSVFTSPLTLPPSPQSPENFLLGEKTSLFHFQSPHMSSFYLLLFILGEKNKWKSIRPSKMPIKKMIANIFQSFHLSLIPDQIFWLYLLMAQSKIIAFAFLLHKFCCTIWNVTTFQFLHRKYFQSRLFPGKNVRKSTYIKLTHIYIFSTKKILFGITWCPWKMNLS